jgi:hypothetical protein
MGAQTHKSNTIHKQKHENTKRHKKLIKLSAGLVSSQHSIKLHYTFIYVCVVPTTTDSLNYKCQFDKLLFRTY